MVRKALVANERNLSSAVDPDSISSPLIAIEFFEVWMLAITDIAMYCASKI